MSFRACTEANDMKLARTSAAEDEIFVHRGLGKHPQQAETENPPPGGIFCFEPFLIRKALLAKETLNMSKHMPSDEKHHAGQFEKQTIKSVYSRTKT